MRVPLAEIVVSLIGGTGFGEEGVQSFLVVLRTSNEVRDAASLIVDRKVDDSEMVDAQLLCH